MAEPTANELILQGLREEGAARLAQQSQSEPELKYVSSIDALASANSGAMKMTDVMGRAGYIESRMSDMPDVYKNQMPITSDAAALARAEEAIRTMLRRDMMMHNPNASATELIGQGLK